MARRQCCTYCGNPDRYEYQVKPDVWAAVVPEKLRTTSICLACFDTLAHKAGVNYAAALQAVYFFGERAAFELTVAKAVDLEPVALNRPPSRRPS